MIFQMVRLMCAYIYVQVKIQVLMERGDKPATGIKVYNIHI